MKILVIDIGGSKLKVLATGQKEPRKIPSGKSMTPQRMVQKVQELTKDWEFEVISIGYPGLVDHTGPVIDPVNLGKGWVGFDFDAAFGRPVKVMNDAAMQALGSYDGGRMLFLGLGTAVGSTYISGTIIVPLEIGQLPYPGKSTLAQVLGRRGMKRMGRANWNRAVRRIVKILMGAFAVDYVVLGGGNAEKLKRLPEGARRGDNDNAFHGGFRFWHEEVTHIHAEEPKPSNGFAYPVKWVLA